MLYDDSVSTTKYWRGGASDLQIALGDNPGVITLSEITNDGFKMRLPTKNTEGVSTSPAQVRYIAIK